MNFRASIIAKTGKPISQNFKTKEEVDEWILEIAEKMGVKLYAVKNLNTGKIIEKGKNL